MDSDSNRDTDRQGHKGTGKGTQTDTDNLQKIGALKELNFKKFDKTEF